MRTNQEQEAAPPQPKGGAIGWSVTPRLPQKAAIGRLI
jgi:hypothetical protein